MGVRTYIYDKFMQMADGAAAMVASGFTQVSAATKILDLGGAASRTDLGIVGGNARLDAAIVLDISAIATVTDGLYRIHVLGSNVSSMANPVSLASLVLGLGSLIPNGTAGSEVTAAGSTTLPGRREILFCNEQNDIIFEYIALYVEALGTTSKSVQFTAFCSVLPEI